MRIIFPLLLFSICITETILPQTTYTAIVTDPQIGAEENVQKLIDVVNDINARDSISFVVVMGNITANGMFDEFLSAQEILDKLLIPYNVIGCKKDYTLSEGKGNEISLLWGDDKFYHVINGNAFVGINIIQPIQGTQSYFDIESRTWFGNVLKENLQNQIFLFRYSNKFHPISNWIKLLDERKKVDPVGRTKLNLILLDEEKSHNKTQMPYIYLGKSFGVREGWKYFLIKINKRGLSKLEITKFENEVKVNEEVLNILDRLPIRSSNIHKKEEFIASPSMLWKTELGKSIASKPAVENNNIYLAGKYGHVICIDQSGKEKWNYQTTGTIYSSPLGEKDLVVAATNEGDLFTINANNGNLFQVIGIGETITSDIALVDIEYNGMQTKGICFGTAEGNFYCYELYSLEMIWSNQPTKDMINSSVATVKGKVIFQDKEGTLYCLNSRSGALLWKWKVKIKNFGPLFKSDLILSDDNIFLIDFDGKLHCIDVLLGTEKWDIKKIKATGIMELDEGKSEIILHSAKNKLLIVSINKRKVIRDYKFPDATINEIATDIFSIDNKLFACFTDGSVYKINQNLQIIFRGAAPIVSINQLNENILVTDYDGNLTLLDISEDKK